MANDYTGLGRWWTGLRYGKDSDQYSDYTTAMQNEQSASEEALLSDLLSKYLQSEGYGPDTSALGDTGTTSVSNLLSDSGFANDFTNWVTKEYNKGTVDNGKWFGNYTYDELQKALENTKGTNFTLKLENAISNSLGNVTSDLSSDLSKQQEGINADILSQFASTAGTTSGGSFGQSDFASLLEENRGDALTDTSQFSSVVPAEDYSKLLDNTANKSYNNKKTGGSLNASTLKAFGG